jgi:ADP-heptose:LPS heptosyltransferase
MAKFSELKYLIPKIFKIIKIEIVIPEYNKKIFTVCFKISELLKDKKLVRDFFKLSS